jgi:hypothetical protein
MEVTTIARKDVVMADKGLRIALTILITGIGLAVTGCRTYDHVEPLGNSRPPPSKPTALALGEINITEAQLSPAEHAAMRNAFVAGVEGWCLEHSSLEVLKNVAVTNLPRNAILLEGAIREIEPGSSSARFWIGFGAGQARASGDFQIIDPDGTNLAAFAARKSYWGDQGVGGTSRLKIDELVRELGRLVAQKTDEWVREIR